MGVRGAWMLQKGLYEGIETCQKGLYVCVYLLHIANMRKKFEPLFGDVCK